MGGNDTYYAALAAESRPNFTPPVPVTTVWVLSSGYLHTKWEEGSPRVNLIAVYRNKPSLDRLSQDLVDFIDSVAAVRSIGAGEIVMVNGEALSLEEKELE